MLEDWIVDWQRLAPPGTSTTQESHSRIQDVPQLAPRPAAIDPSFHSSIVPWDASEAVWVLAVGMLHLVAVIFLDSG